VIGKMSSCNDTSRIALPSNLCIDSKRGCELGIRVSRSELYLKHNFPNQVKADRCGERCTSSRRFIRETRCFGRHRSVYFLIAPVLTIRVRGPLRDACHPAENRKNTPPSYISRNDPIGKDRTSRDTPDIQDDCTQRMARPMRPVDTVWSGQHHCKQTQTPGTRIPGSLGRFRGCRLVVVSRG
jgi:hypothetical protein